MFYIHSSTRFSSFVWCHRYGWMNHWIIIRKHYMIYKFNTLWLLLFPWSILLYNMNLKVLNLSANHAWFLCGIMSYCCCLNYACVDGICKAPSSSLYQISGWLPILCIHSIMPAALPYYGFALLGTTTAYLVKISMRNMHCSSFWFFKSVKNIKSSWYA